MPQIYEGKLDAKGLKFAIVVSRFNDFITERLMSGAIDVLNRHNASDKDIDVIKVPGSYEILFAVKKAAELKKYDAIIALGAIIRGQTSHFDFLASTVTSQLATIGLDHNIPVSSGVITTETLEQAIERAGSKAGNRGGDAAFSAIEMSNLAKTLSRKR
ncbi:MAG: 6,7-dimethyl-8-ribityllumazine synthase [Thermodesulfobacteriales bacterium]|jgi:6,7-dimethyl-8-ribityllumazine synthase|nr:MAG: 6,7-dimethyl-8-ribityllumazine synthase [Thermodesulfobacteriales bacterium]